MQKLRNSLEVQASNGEFEFANVGVIIRGERFLDESKILKVFVDRVEELLLADLCGSSGHGSVLKL